MRLHVPINMSAKLLRLLGGATGRQTHSILHEAVSQAHWSLASRDFKNVTELLMFCSQTLQQHPDALETSSIDAIIRDVCYPITSKWTVDDRRGDKKKEETDVFQAACEFIAVIMASQHHPELCGQLMKECTEGLSNYREEIHPSAHASEPSDESGDPHRVCNISASSAVNILELYHRQLNQGGVITIVSDEAHRTWWQKMVHIIVDLLEFMDSSMCVQLTKLVVQESSIALSGRTKDEIVQLIWTQLLEMSQRATTYSNQTTANIYLICCALSDVFLPVSEESNITEVKDASGSLPTRDILSDSSPCKSGPILLDSNEFWELIQRGLAHSDPLTRKRAGFLMKRAVDVAATQGRVICGNTELSRQPLFSWDPALKDRLVNMWLEFFLVYETLDEVQVHVVIPVLPRLANLTRATYTTDGKDLPLLHSSWLCILYQRSFVHESKTITRKGVLQCLELDLTQSSFLSQNGIQFILGPLLDALHGEYLYTKPSDVAPGSHPAIGKALKAFMSSCVTLLPDAAKKDFLENLLSLIREQSWGPVTLAFLAEAMMNIPSCPAWGLSSLHNLRDKLLSGLLTCPAGYRATIQCFLLKASLRLLDWNTISLRQVSNLFAVCNSTKILIRGTPLWNEVCLALPDQLSPAVKSSNEIQTPVPIWQQCLQEVKGHLSVDLLARPGEEDELPDTLQARRVAVAVLLVADAQQQNSSSQVRLSDLIQPVRDVLCKVGSHVYIPTSKSDRAIQLLVSLLQESRAFFDESDATVILSSLLGDAVSEIFQYISRRLLGSDDSQQYDVTRVTLYGSFLDALLSHIVQLDGGGQVSNVIFQRLTMVLQDGRKQLLEGCKVLMNGQQISDVESVIQQQYRMITLTTLLTWILSTASYLPVQDLPTTSYMLKALLRVDGATLKKSTQPVGDEQKGLEGAERGRFQCELIQTKWEAILLLIQRHDGMIGGGGGGGGVDDIKDEMWQQVFSSYLDDIDLVSAVPAVPLLKCAAILIDKIGDQNIPLCLEGLTAAWCAVQDGWKAHSTFWCVYEAFMGVAFQPALLQYEEGTEAHATIQKYTSNILSHGETRLGMVNSLMSHLETSLSDHFFSKPKECHKYDAITVIRNISSLLFEAALFGPITPKSIRLMEDISGYLVKHEDLQSIRHLILDNSNAINPRHVRVSVINILMQIGSSHLQGSEEFFYDFLTALLKRDFEITPGRRSYIVNSMVHRKKMRIWQTVVVILHFLSQESSASVLMQVLKSLRAENQTSIRHLMEVFVVRLIQLYPHLLDQFWKHTVEVANDQEISFSPLLMIIAHLGPVQPQHKQEEFYLHAIPTVLPWTFVPAMALRTQAQLSLFKMWTDCKEAGLVNVIDRFPGVAVCMDFTQNSSALHSLRLRLDGSFFLRLFHPVKDFSIETMFHTLPYLTNVTEDELVEPEMFLMSEASPWTTDSHHVGIPLYNVRDTLRTCQLKEKKKNKWAKDAEIAEVSWTEEGAGDVQKKITPWKECHIPGFESSAHQGSVRGHLVVVASLVDRIPNLGGLCRTCEIFGASCLVLGNISYKDSQDFLSLSVSAERWLPIREVRPCELKDYMLEMKKHGYSLVGVEQTANSQSLTEFKFPQRTMLLLGKEREGIPVELIQLLDVCVEIPQLGFIRSLNVHVSGALMIWEYTRQKLLNS